MSKRVIIVGAGLFGSIAAKLAFRAGFDVLVLDRGEAQAGSHAAACLMRPSWLTSLGDKVPIAMATLESLYGVSKVTMKVGPLNADLSWVSPNAIRLPTPQEHDIVKLDDGFHIARRDLIQYGDGKALVSRRTWGRGEDTPHDLETLAYDHLLIAAGVWSKELAPYMPDIDALRGEAQLYDAQLHQPFVTPWAPYKQVVGFNITPDTVWGGDGSAILAKNWSKERSQQVRDRIDSYMPETVVPHHISTMVGLRPYVKGHKQGYFHSPQPGVYVSTGGAKNGTVLAAYQAKCFVDAITNER
jgi:glycine/D-amino acid oxidase-like deaminating enzyme